MTDREHDLSDYERHFEGRARREMKERKKILSHKDRSQHKKTDRDKKVVKREEEQEKWSTMPIGRILSIKPLSILVDCEGREFDCVLRGALKQESEKVKNLITIGDFVRFEPLSEKEGAIVFVEKRKSVLSRADNLSRQKEQLIAANIDQVLITASVFLPAIKPPLIDRYIIASMKGNMEPIVVINKVDLLSEEGAEEEKWLMEEVVGSLSRAGIKTVRVSVKTGQGIGELKKLMEGKTSVFSGQSGVGKSSLINAVTGLDLLVGDTVKKTGKGAHTTTSAHLVPLQGGGFCIDTPGIKSFGLWNLKKDELQSYFSEIEEAGRMCYFPDCSHTHEEGCAVKEALEEGKISFVRYQSYASLMESMEDDYKRR